VAGLTGTLTDEQRKEQRGKQQARLVVKVRNWIDTHKKSEPCPVYRAVTDNMAGRYRAFDGQPLEAAREALVRWFRKSKKHADLVVRCNFDPNAKA
jgi:hypothetical protein